MHNDFQDNEEASIGQRRLLIFVSVRFYHFCFFAAEIVYLFRYSICTDSGSQAASRGRGESLGIAHNSGAGPNFASRALRRCGDAAGLARRDGLSAGLQGSARPGPVIPLKPDALAACAAWRGSANEIPERDAGGRASSQRPERQAACIAPPPGAPRRATPRRVRRGSEARRASLPSMKLTGSRVCLDRAG